MARPVDEEQAALGRQRLFDPRPGGGVSFVNSYEWGNSKGDPRKLMERYFDAHLYLANWGTREVMLRLPKRVLDPARVADYCVGKRWDC